MRVRVDFFNLLPLGLCQFRFVFSASSPELHLPKQSSLKTDVLQLSPFTLGEPPVHDRWWLTKDAGLRLGTSFNGLGMTKDSDISSLSSQEISDRETHLNQYLFGLKREPLDLPDNPLQTLSQIADLLRETLDRARRSEIKAHEAKAIGYVTTILVDVMEKEDHQEAKAQRSAAADAFLKTVFPERTPVAAAAEQGIEEQVMAAQGTKEQGMKEQGTKEQGMKKDPADELAALLFADDNSFPENAKPEIASNSNDKHEPTITTPQPVPLPSTQETTNQDQNAWNGASLEFLAISRRVLEEQSRSENQSESVNRSQSVSKSQNINGSKSAHQSPAPSSPVSLPAKQDAARNQANPDEQFSGTPGLQQRHVNYMKFLPLPETARRKQRKPAFRTASAAIRADEMREIAARLRGW